MTAWAQQNPFPPEEGSTVFDVVSVFRGHKCATSVVGMARVMWTAALWSEHGHDCIKWKPAKEAVIEKASKDAANNPRPFYLHRISLCNIREQMK